MYTYFFCKLIQRNRSKSKNCPPSKNRIIQSGLRQITEDHRNTATSTVEPLPVDVAYVKNENDLLREANRKLNARVGDEIISDDSSIDSLDDFQTEINTRYYQYDQPFSGKYGFITNVSFEIKYTEECFNNNFPFSPLVSRRPSLLRRRLEDQVGNSPTFEENELKLPT